MFLHTSYSFFDAEFSDFLKLGWDHIIDLKAFDHLLFVLTLCAFFTYKEWRKILVIITAFTIGHSLTLALSSFDYILIPQDWIELFIPFTILFTAISNIIQKKEHSALSAFDRKLLVNYGIALGFGLIHGMGFANNFKFMLGENNSILKQLFAFNTGLELGQITVVISFMLIMYFLFTVFKISHRDWNLFFSGAGAGLAVMMLINVMFP